MPKDRSREAERARRARRKPPPPGTRRDDESEVLLYGWHPVLEALRNPRRSVRRLLATENSARRLEDELRQLPVTPEIVRPDAINRLLEPDAVHQGLYLAAGPLPAPALHELAEDALVVVLDQITDPHNFGAILRSCAAFGVDAAITTVRHSPAATGVLAKSASGGLEHVPVVVVRNLAEGLIALGERGFQRLGLDSDGAAALGDIEVRRPLALVLGAEGKGLRQRTRECCDIVGRLDMPGAIKSLNVSNAAAIALYALSRRLGA
jgi:23S rRNA (guanosine2251-2'-O)-methyltransferase